VSLMPYGLRQLARSISRLSPDFEQPRCFVGDKDRITHSAARQPIGECHFLPERQTPNPELRKLFAYFPAQALPLSFFSAFTATRKHSELVPPPPDEQDAPSF
jgi:hypothetical protein